MRGWYQLERSLRELSGVKEMWLFKYTYNIKRYWALYLWFCILLFVNYASVITEKNIFPYSWGKKDKSSNPTVKTLFGSFSRQAVEKLIYDSYVKLKVWTVYWWHWVIVTSISSVQSLSHVQLFATPWTATHQASLSITNSQSLLKLRSIESVMPSSHLIPCHPLLLLPSIFPSIRVLSNESVLWFRWPKYWSFSH